MKLEERIEHLNTYLISVDRKTLDALMRHFAKIGEVEVGVESTGEISFHIKSKSEIKLVQINMLSELLKKVKGLEDKKEKLKETGSAYRKADELQQAILQTLDVLIDIYEEKMDF